MVPALPHIPTMGETKGQSCQILLATQPSFSSPKDLVTIAVPLTSRIVSLAGHLPLSRHHSVSLRKCQEHTVDPDRVGLAAQPLRLLPIKSSHGAEPANLITPTTKTANDTHHKPWGNSNSLFFLVPSIFQTPSLPRRKCGRAVVSGSRTNGKRPVWVFSALL